MTAIVNGGSIEDSHGTAADLSGLVGAAAGLSINSPLTVASIAASRTGELAIGQTVQITLEMSEAATLASFNAGPLTLTLNDGGQRHLRCVPIRQRVGNAGVRLYRRRRQGHVRSDGHRLSI